MADPDRAPLSTRIFCALTWNMASRCELRDSTLCNESFSFFPYTSPTRKSEPASRLMMMMMTVNITGMFGQISRRWPIVSKKNVGDIIR